MARKGIHHVSVVVEDLEAAIRFFEVLEMEKEGAAEVGGEWVDRINGVEGIKAEIVMMRDRDGEGRLEVTKFHSPGLAPIEPKYAPPNTAGLRSVMFNVESVTDMVEKLKAVGGELLGEVVDYEDYYRLCYMRGPAGIIVALAEELS